MESIFISQAEDFKNLFSERTSALTLVFTLRKHAYSNILKILQPKKEIFR